MKTWQKRLTCSHDARGNIAPLVVVASLLLLVVLSLSVDQGIACVAKIRQENALDTARAACMDASFALPAKNSENPGKKVAQRCMDVLRSEGYRGSVTVWFYEALANEVPRSRRVWGVGIQLQEDVPAVFARGYGVMFLPVASKRILMAEPYADTAAWRPQESGSGRYTISSDELIDGCSFERLQSIDEYPVELGREIRAQLNQVAHEAKGKVD